MRAPPLQSFTKTHIDQLVPLVTDEHLDKIENLIKSIAAVAEEPYKTRIENQLILWNFARLEVKAIYETMLAAYMFDKLTAESREADRLYVLTIAKQALEHTGKAAEILVSSPSHLRGPHVYKDSGALVGGYHGHLHNIVSQLEKQ